MPLYNTFPLRCTQFQVMCYELRGFEIRTGFVARGARGLRVSWKRYPRPLGAHRQHRPRPMGTYGPVAAPGPRPARAPHSGPAVRPSARGPASAAHARHEWPVRLAAARRRQRLDGAARGPHAAPRGLRGLAVPRHRGLASPRPRRAACWIGWDRHAGVAWREHSARAAAGEGQGMRPGSGLA